MGFSETSLTSPARLKSRFTMNSLFSVANTISLPWPFFQTLLYNYEKDGLLSIKKFEEEKLARYNQQLKDAYKPAHIISYKTLIFENGGKL